MRLSFGQKMKLKVVDTREETDVAYVDGYWYGDRQLEGVLFEVKIEDDKLKLVSVEKSCKEYYHRFSKKLRKEWEKSIQDDLDKGGIDNLVTLGDKDVEIVN